jgi:hypothetical protein
MPDFNVPVTLQDGRQFNVPVSGVADEAEASAAVEKQVANGVLTFPPPPSDTEGAPMQPQQQAAQDEQETNEARSLLRSIAAGEDLSEEQLGANAAKLQALAELGVTGATGFIGTIFGGMSGLLHARRTKDLESSAQLVKDVEELITYTPSEETQEIIAPLGTALTYIDEMVDAISWNGGLENPFAAAVIKTSIYGAVELAGLGGINRLRVPAAVRKIEKDAKQMGVRLTNNTMKTDLREVLDQMTPAEFAEFAPQIQKSMLEASEQANAAVKRGFKEAAAVDALMKRGDVADFGKGLRKRMVAEQWDLADFPEASGILSDIINVSPGRSATSLNELMVLRKRINRRSPKVPEEGEALSHIRRELDDFIDNQFDQDAIAAGNGDTEALTRWRDAIDASKSYHERFTDVGAIKNLISQDADPMTVRAWLVGSSKIGMTQESLSVARRLVEELGPSHPGIKGIQQDILLGLAEDLFNPDIKIPNFKGFNKRYDTFMRSNRQTAEALGMNMQAMDEMRRMTGVAAALPDPKKAATLDSLIKATGQFFVGHDVAKGAMRVNAWRNMGNILFGVNRVSQRSIIAELTGAEFGKPLFKRRGPLAGAFIADGVIQELTEIEKERRAKRGIIQRPNK